MLDEVKDPAAKDTVYDEGENPAPVTAPVKPPFLSREQREAEMQARRAALQRRLEISGMSVDQAWQALHDAVVVAPGEASVFTGKNTVAVAKEVADLLRDIAPSATIEEKDGKHEVTLTQFARTHLIGKLAQQSRQR